MDGTAIPVLMPLWQQRVSHEVRGLVSAGDRLVAQAGSLLLGLLPSGRCAWSREFKDLGGRSRLVSMAGSVYLETDAIERIDARTGHTLMRRSLGPDMSLGSESGLLTCTSGTSGRFHVLDPETLQTVASCIDLEERVSLHGGLLCETTEDHVLVLRDPWTGVEIGRLTAPDRAAHVHHAQSVCFFSATERLALDLGSGRTVWQKQTEPDSGEGTAPLPLRYRDLAFVAGRGVSAYDLVTGERRWRALEQEPGLRLRLESIEGRVVLDSESRVHVVDSTTGRRVGSRDCGLTISIPVLAPGGLVAVLGVTAEGDRELHGLLVVSATP